MIEDLSDVIDELASGTYTVTRSAPQTTDGKGRVVPGAPSTFSIVASVQPVSGRQLLRLPEGLRTKELIQIFTATPLLTAAAPGGAPPDVVTWSGHSYQVEVTNDWTESVKVGSYIASKVGQ